MQVKAGSCTPDNPFVLGYGISQKLPSLQDINPNVNLAATPRYFIPKCFNLTTTPASAQSASQKFTNGTLNFNMLTHRPFNPSTGKEEPGRNTDPAKDPAAGFLSETFFDVTKTAVHDGVMAFAQDLLMKRYIIGYMAPLFWIDPTKFAALKGASYNTKPVVSTSTPSPTEFIQQTTFETSLSGAEFSVSGLYRSLKRSKGAFDLI
jgi:hypothetical protein